MYFTVFTPTYNRAYVLGEAYKSLINQTFKDFQWIIVDDGSQDDTEELVKRWRQEDILDIVYIKQENMGRFAAYNSAISYFKGELIAFLDSDDRFKENALEELKNVWEHRDKTYQPEPIGIIHYMESSEGEIHGNELPDVYCAHLADIRGKYRVNGDKGQVYAREIIEKFKYPLFQGEKFIGDSLIFDHMSKFGGLIILRKSVYIRDYLENGLTKNVASIHYHSPRGMALFYKESMQYYKGYFAKKLNCAMKYVTFSKIAGQNICTKDLDAGRKLLVLLMYIPGIIYLIILRNRALMSDKKN